MWNIGGMWSMAAMIMGLLGIHIFGKTDPLET